MGGTQVSADQIYSFFHENSPGNKKLDAAQQAAEATQKMHPELSDMIRSISTRMDAAWQGQASTAAQGATNPLVQTTMQSGDELRGAHQTMSNQSAAYSTAASQIQKMPDAPHWYERLNPFGDSMATDIKRLETGAVNSAAYGNYVQASTANQRAVPQQYGTLNTDSSGVQVAPPPPPPGPGGTQTGGYNGQTGSYNRARTSGGSYPGGGYTPPGPIPGGPQPTPTPTPGPQPVQPGQPPVGWQPIGNDPVGWRPGDQGYVPDPGGPGVNQGPGFNSGGGGVDGPGGGFGPGGGGYSSGGSAGGSGGRFGSGGGFGAGGEEEGGVGGRGSGFGPKGPGGFGPGGATEGGVLGRGAGGGMGAAGRTGAPGAGGMGMGAGGRGGKGEDDGEHHSASYLQDDYSGEIVGDLGLTAPPVIGE